VAAALGTDLILDMGGSGAGLDQVLDGAFDVEGTRPEAGVDVHQQRQVADIGDTAYIGEHVIQRVDTQIRQAQGTGRHTTTGQVNGTEAGAFGEQRMVSVDRADHLQGLFFGKGLTETLTWRKLTHDSPRGLADLGSAPCPALMAK